MIQTWEIQNESDWLPIAKWVLARRQHADLIWLEGPMGAGKTTFVRICLEELGYPHASSPTYALHHEYPLSSGVVDHLDLFRFKSPDEWAGSGFDELFQRPEGLMFIEWPSQAPNLYVPAQWKQHQLKIELREDGVRNVEYRDL